MTWRPVLASFWTKGSCGEYPFGLADLMLSRSTKPTSGGIRAWASNHKREQTI
jgi:hypothetical protein